METRDRLGPKGTWNELSVRLMQILSTLEDSIEDWRTDTNVQLRKVHHGKNSQPIQMQPPTKPPMCAKGMQ
ncbi:unnamed protein product [Caretta caretta]